MKSLTADLLVHEHGRYDIMALFARDVYNELTGWTSSSSSSASVRSAGTAPYCTGRRGLWASGPDLHKNFIEAWPVP